MIKTKLIKSCGILFAGIILLASCANDSSDNSNTAAPSSNANFTTFSKEKLENSWSYTQVQKGYKNSDSTETVTRKVETILTFKDGKIYWENTAENSNYDSNSIYWNSISDALGSYRIEDGKLYIKRNNWSDNEYSIPTSSINITETELCFYGNFKTSTSMGGNKDFYALFMEYNTGAAQIENVIKAEKFNNNITEGTYSYKAVGTYYTLNTSNPRYSISRDNQAKFNATLSFSNGKIKFNSSNSNFPSWEGTYTTIGRKIKIEGSYTSAKIESVSYTVSGGTVKIIAKDSEKTYYHPIYEINTELKFTANDNEIKLIINSSYDEEAPFYAVDNHAGLTSENYIGGKLILTKTNSSISNNSESTIDASTLDGSYTYTEGGNYKVTYTVVFNNGNITITNNSTNNSIGKVTGTYTLTSSKIKMSLKDEKTGNAVSDEEVTYSKSGSSLTLSDNTTVTGTFFHSTGMSVTMTK